MRNNFKSNGSSKFKGFFNWSWCGKTYVLCLCIFIYIIYFKILVSWGTKKKGKIKNICQNLENQNSDNIAMFELRIFSQGYSKKKWLHTVVQSFNSFDWIRIGAPICKMQLILAFIPESLAYIMTELMMWCLLWRFSFEYSDATLYQPKLLPSIYTHQFLHFWFFFFLILFFHTYG